MAKINGLQIKNVVNFKGHEGEGLFQCDVYHNGKKVGWFSQNAWGGPDEIHVNNDVVELFKDYPSDALDKTKQNPNAVFYGIEWAIIDLYGLKQTERAFKSNDSRGFPGTVEISDWMLGKCVGISNNLCRKSDDEIIAYLRTKLSPDYGKCANTAFKVYRSLEDFNVRV